MRKIIVKLQNVRKKYVTCNGIMCVFIRLEIREKKGVRDNSYVSSLNNLEENNDICTTRGCDILSPALADLPNHIFTILGTLYCSSQAIHYPCWQFLGRKTGRSEKQEGYQKYKLNVFH